MAISSTRLTFLFAGKYNTAGDKYTQFKKSDLDNLSHVTGFVVGVTANYDIYKTGPFTDLINDVMGQVAIVSQTGKPFYIGIPAVNFGMSTYTRRSADYTNLKSNYILKIWNQISANSTYKSLFKGFYCTNERVFGTTNVSSPVSSNAQIGLLNDLAYTIRNDTSLGMQKEFIWSPYMGYNSAYYEINTNIGIVANRTNIFNTIFLQSNYYFTPAKGAWNGSSGIIPQTLDMAIKSATDNKLYNFSAKGNFTSYAVVGGTKTSSTKIALNMEAEDALKWKQSTYSSYYETACNKMKVPLLNGSCPFIFYAGSYNGIVKANLRASIKGFYTDGSCVLP